MRIVQLDIDPEKFATVDAISLVEFPAIEVDFLAFKKQNKPSFKFELAKIDEEKRLVIGPAMIPHKMIMRIDEKTKENYYVFFSPKTIRNAAYEYLKANRQHSATIEHEASVNGVTLVESWITESSQDKAAHLGYKVPPGTWMISMKIENDEVWNLVKKQSVKGFSIEGFFTESASKINNKKQEMKLVDKIRNKLKSAKFESAELTDGQGTVTNGTENPFAVGDSLFILTEDGEQLPVPDGAYMTTDGRNMVVAEGVISEIGESEEMEEPKPEEMDGLSAIIERLDKIENRIKEVETATKDAGEAAEVLAETLSKIQNKGDQPRVNQRVKTKFENQKNGRYNIGNAVSKYLEIYG
jgi:hypothetical protein